MTAVEVAQVRAAAVMLRTPTASWHREAMAERLLAMAEPKPRKARKAKRFDPFTEAQLAKFLKVKLPSRAAVRAKPWPVGFEHDGTIIEDGKTATAYLKAMAA